MVYGYAWQMSDYAHYASIGVDAFCWGGDSNTVQMLLMARLIVQRVLIVAAPFDIQYGSGIRRFSRQALPEA